MVDYVERYYQKLCGGDKSKSLMESKQSQGQNLDSQLIKSIETVMCDFFTFNRNFDLLKEFVFYNCGCAFFSAVIHNMAHDMLRYADDFGRILHTVNLKIPYPLAQDIKQYPKNLSDVFTTIFTSMDTLQEDIAKCSKLFGENFANVGIESKLCIMSEWANHQNVLLLNIRHNWENCDQDMVKFDSYVKTYCGDGLYDVE